MLPLEEFERATPVKFLPYPLLGVVDIAREPRLLLSHSGADVHVWQLPEVPADGSVPAPAVSDSAGSAADAAAPKKLLLLRPKLVERNLRCAALSEDGTWLVACHAEVVLYRLTLPTEGTSQPSLKRVPLPEDVVEASCCAFSPDRRLLFLGGCDGLLQAVTLDEASPSILNLRPPPEAAPGLPRPAFLRIAVSSDGQWLATLDATQTVHAHSIDGLCYSSTAPALASPYGYTRIERRSRSWLPPSIPSLRL